MSTPDKKLEYNMTVLVPFKYEGVDDNGYAVLRRYDQVILANEEELIIPQQNPINHRKLTTEEV